MEADIQQWASVRTKRKRFENLQYSRRFLSRHHLILIGLRGTCAYKFPSSILPSAIGLPFLFSQSPFFPSFFHYFIYSKPRFTCTNLESLQRPLSMELYCVG